MANRKTRLKLTWIGKENRPKLEPRVLIEDPDKSYHAAHRVSEDDIFDNRLIFGDNLLALKPIANSAALRAARIMAVRGPSISGYFSRCCWITNSLLRQPAWAAIDWHQRSAMRQALRHQVSIDERRAAALDR